MQAYKPLSSVADYPAINQANYPGLQVAITPDAVDVAASPPTFTDPITGAVQAWNVISGSFSIGGGGDFVNLPVTYLHQTTGTSGTIPGPAAAKKVLQIYVGSIQNDFTSAGVNGGQTGFQMATGSNDYIAKDASNVKATPAMSKSAVVGSTGCTAMMADLSGDTAELYVYDDNGYEAGSYVTALGSISGAWGNISATTAQKFDATANGVMYGLYLFYLDHALSADEMKALVAWQYENPTRLHPMLRGRS